MPLQLVPLQIIVGNARASSIRFNNTDIIAFTAGNIRLVGNLTVNSQTLISSSMSLGNGANTSVGTLTNAPIVGNPTKWIPINDNGTIRYIPAW